MNSCTYYRQYGLQIMDNNFHGNLCISSQEFTGMLKLAYFWILKLFLHGCYVQKSWNKRPKTENCRISIFYPLSFPDFDILAWGSMGKRLLTCCKCSPWTVVVWWFLFLIHCKIKNISTYGSWIQTLKYRAWYRQWCPLIMTPLQSTFTQWELAIFRQGPVSKDKMAKNGSFFVMIAW